MKTAIKAMVKGVAAEEIIKKAYINGETGDFTVDIMRNISVTGVIFNGRFNHDGRRHEPDGYIQIGRTMHIFEMKDGARYNEKYTGQVNRYAHVMSMFFDFDRVITYIIYGGRKEVDIEEIQVGDISSIYAATRRVDDKAYNWKVDQRESMTESDKAAQKVASRGYEAKFRANRTEEQKVDDKVKGRAKSAKHRANRTIEEKAQYNEQQRIAVAKSNAGRTPEQKAIANEKMRIAAKIRRANRTPEQIAIDKEKKRVARVAKKAAAEAAAANS